MLLNNLNVMIYLAYVLLCCNLNVMIYLALYYCAVKGSKG